MTLNHACANAHDPMAMHAASAAQLFAHEVGDVDVGLLRLARMDLAGALRSRRVRCSGLVSANLLEQISALLSKLMDFIARLFGLRLGSQPDDAVARFHLGQALSREVGNRSLNAPRQIDAIRNDIVRATAVVAQSEHDLASATAAVKTSGSPAVGCFDGCASDDSGLGANVGGACQVPAASALSPEEREKELLDRIEALRRLLELWRTELKALKRELFVRRQRAAAVDVNAAGVSDDRADDEAVVLDHDLASQRPRGGG